MTILNWGPISPRSPTARPPILALCVLIAACTSHAHIVEPTTPQGFEAVHFDNLLGSACTAGAGGERCTFLADFPLPPAFGASASPLSVDTGAVSLTWQAFVYDVVDTSSRPTSETFMLMAFSDTNVSAGLIAGLPFGQVLVDTTTIEIAGNESFGDSALATIGPCAAPPTLHHATLPSVGQGVSCTIRTFSVNATINLQTGTIVTIAPQNVSGIRIVK